MSEVSASTGSSTPSTTTVSATPPATASSPQPSQTPESKPSSEAPSTKKKFKHTIDGQDVEEEIDLSDEAGLQKRLQLAYAADKRMKEAKETKTKAFDIIKQFENDPGSILDRLPPEKAREISEKWLLKQIQGEMLTPEQKKLIELEKYKETSEKEKAEAKAAQEKQQAEVRANEYREKFQATIIEALEKSGLPKSPVLVAEMARLMRKNLDLGITLDASDLAEMVKKEKLALLKSIVGEADAGKLLSMFGDDIANKIRKHDLQTLQEKQAAFKAQGAQPNTQTKSRDEREPVSIEQWKEDLNNRFK